MVVHADALSDRLGAVHLAARGPAVAMDEPEVRDASWTRARSRARRVAGRRRPSRRRRRGILGSVGERLERRGAARGGRQNRQRQAPERHAGFGAAVGARIARARRASPRASRRRGHGGRAPAPREIPSPAPGSSSPTSTPPPPSTSSRTSPRSSARASRRSRRRARRAQVPDIVVEDDPALVTGSPTTATASLRIRPGYTAVVVARSTTTPPGAEARGPWSSGRLSMGTATHVEGGGHLADAAWREIDLRRGHPRDFMPEASRAELCEFWTSPARGSRSARTSSTSRASPPSFASCDAGV